MVYFMENSIYKWMRTRGIPFLESPIYIYVYIYIFIYIRITNQKADDGDIGDRIKIYLELGLIPKYCWTPNYIPMMIMANVFFPQVWRMVSHW